MNERIYTFKDGRETIFDAEDTELICQFSLYISNTGYVSGGYCVAGKHGSILIHRAILSPSKGLLVDHINGDKLDNRRCNLRIATRAQNAANTPKIMRASNRSNYKGVVPRCNRFLAHIMHNYKNIYLGSFDNEISAALAYNEAAIKYFGEFAYLNKIPNN